MAVEIPPSPTVEATSLASILDIASNPPSEPTTSPARAVPLVLYIARVPGSRDVFLTPIKPREKVVTASDVQSSLYYVHIHGTTPAPHSSSDSESTLLQNNNAIPPMLPERPQGNQRPPPLPRRPLPPASPPLASGNGAPLLPIGPAGSRPTIPRKPPVPIRSESRGTFADLPVLPPRPLPPTPPQDDVDDEQHSPHGHDLRLMTQTEQLNNSHSRDYSDSQEELQTLQLECSPDSGTLTLIRRDPGSQEQWNVAMIHDPPVPEVSSSSFHVPTAKRRTKKGGAPLYLDILNPGYSQFTPMITRTESEMSASTTSSSSEDVEPPSGGVFRRRLYMPGSKYAEHGYRKSWHRKRSSASIIGSLGRVATMPSTLRGERHSVDLGSMEGSPRADRRAKGYTFISPWDGQCEFNTGATGRTLKCQHHIHSTSQRPARSVEVSELRFNLPNPARSARPGLLSRSSYFSERQHLFESLSEDGSQSPSIVINEDGKIDLTLGQEKAGGGSGGKQAKLGKLIIEPEGFGMLDLLVASNIGLWFRAWERA